MNDLKSENVIINAEEQFKSNNAKTVVDLYKSILSNERESLLADLQHIADVFEKISEDCDTTQLEVLTRKFFEFTDQQLKLLSNSKAYVSCSDLKRENYYSNDKSFVLTLNDLIDRDDDIAMTERLDCYKITILDLAKLVAQKYKISTTEALSMPLICEPFIFQPPHQINDIELPYRHHFKIYYTENDLVFCHAEDIYLELFDLNPDMNSLLAA